MVRQCGTLSIDNVLDVLGVLEGNGKTMQDTSMYDCHTFLTSQQVVLHDNFEGSFLKSVSKCGPLVPSLHNTVL